MQLAVQLALLLVPLAASAHESRPAYLALQETTPGQFSVLWRTPVLAGMRLPVILQLPDRVKNLKDPVVSELADSLVERRWVDAGPGGLAGERIQFGGLQLTITDVLVRVQMRDGTVSTTLVTPSRPWIEIAAAPGLLAVAGAYVLHGIEHILFGFDHLLFVLALILIVRSRRILLWTITAFTFAHSITLSLATLGVVHVPGPPVEAMIALSIALLACEIVRMQHGHLSLTSRWPWIVAFTFGLLHGFGFASALTEIGLPQADIPLALFSFNIGVEIGQLIFIGVVLGVLACAKRISVPAMITRGALPIANYAIGSVAAFWFIERLAGFAS
ncbi:HupE / UreJ protein [Bradyrhizobium centrolobii]|uniref:HupE / UreJ protein n=1 Tax=Bradyrhizobium centrolobii TaxID=1505087 RepID=A0A176YX94_9BRAD|nr:HupE/UreJ family protein [Bradyrhizobium centrolobii]OAF11814.1 HupE / UreJ protein [Bradyrhizobium centrolobii]